MAILLTGLAAAAAAGLVVAADTLLQPDRYRPQIAAIVLRETGRALELRGALRIDWSLWPTLRADDVRLANLPGGSRPDMARAERIEAQVSLPSLLRGHIVVTRLTLIGPNILFEQVGGVPNWVFHAGATRARDRPNGDGLAFGGRVPLEFAAAHVRNGMVTIRFPAQTHVIGIRSLDLRDPRALGPLSLAAVLVYADNAPFALSVDARPTGRATDPWITAARFAAFDAAATATGRVALDGSYDVQLDVRAPRLEALNALLAGMNLPPLHGVRLATRLNSGPVPGRLPVPGPTTLHVAGGDGGDRLPGLHLDGLDLLLPMPGGIATLTAHGHLRGAPLLLTGTLAVPGRLDGRHDAPLRLGLRVGPDGTVPAALLSLDGRLALDGLFFAGLDAALRLQAPSLPSLRPTLGNGLPPLTALTVAGRLRVPADGTGASLEAGDMRAREGTLSGNLAVGVRPALSLSGRLHAARIDLDALLPSPAPPTVPPVAAPVPTRAAGPLIPDDPLPWGRLRGPVMEVALAADSVRLRGQDWPDLQATLSLRGGRLLVSLPAGLVQGTAAVDAGAADSVPVSLDLQVPALPLGLLAGGLHLPGPATGILRAHAQLQGHGNSAHALAASLDGRLTLAMGAGTLDDAAVREAAGPVLAALGNRVPASGETAIRCLRLDATVAAGVMRISTLALDSTALTVSGNGAVDLGAETIGLRIWPLARLSGSRVAVPVLVDGSFAAPRGRLQASALDKLALLIDAMFGGDHPRICPRGGDAVDPP